MCITISIPHSCCVFTDTTPCTAKKSGGDGYECGKKIVVDRAAKDDMCVRCVTKQRDAMREQDNLVKEDGVSLVSGRVGSGRVGGGK